MQSITADRFLEVYSGIIGYRHALQVLMLDSKLEEGYLAYAEHFEQNSPIWEIDCRRIGFPATAAGIARARAAMFTEGRLFLRTRLDELRAIFEDEASDIELLALPRRSFSQSTEAPFGLQVSNRFPALTEDIAEASKCLSFGLGTATVFHLMRVMELLIQELGRRLRVRIDVRNSTWNEIAQHTDRGIKLLPAKTTRQKHRKESLALAVAHLNAVRIAWRNGVMHPKATYTSDEAQAIFAHVGQFSISLAKL